MRLERRATPYDPSRWPKDVPNTIMQIYANRGVFSPEDVSRDPSSLLNPHALMGIDKAVDLITDAILNQKYVTVAGDYDCDGATGTAVGVKGLRLLGLAEDRVKFTIPNRDKDGYGLSVGLVNDMPQPTDIIMTVDSGIASNEGVDHAKSLGYTVIITDHHLPGDVAPNADAIVNPNQTGDTFPSKALAGVGVMFYVLLAVKTRLRKLGHPGGQAPLFSELAPYVAIGSVADLVPLDHNNRIIVAAGLQLIRQGHCSEGIKALATYANCQMNYITSTDVAFSLAPRLNAAGRLSDMTLGVKLLLCDNRQTANRYAETLEEINRARKDIQQDMVASAEGIVAEAPKNGSKTSVVFGPTWHHGVVGLVASKLKESLHKPVIAFAPATEGGEDLRGSARSIPGFHLRDALAFIDAKNPGLIQKFGGHAMAAGLSLKLENLSDFTRRFEEVASEWITPEMLESVIYSDGEPMPVEMTVEFCKYMETCGPWGQAFPKPIFDGLFEVKDYKILGEKHLKLELYDTRQGDVYDAIWFFGYKGTPPPPRFRMAYELSINRYGGRENVQLLVRHVTPE